MKNEILELKKSVQNGKDGNVIWYPLHFPKMGRQVGIGKKILTLVGGMAGSGKTAFVDLAYVLRPYLWYLANKDKTNIEFRWIYRSMERSSTYKLAKWTCYLMWIKYKILIDVPTLLNWGMNRSKMTDDIYDKLSEFYDMLERMLDYVEIVDGPCNPTGIYAHVKKYALRTGKEYKIPYMTKDGIERTKKIYKANNKNIITIIILDHVGKMSGESSNGTWADTNSKRLLDKMSSYCSSNFRDYYGFSPVVISQFNRGIEGTQRRTRTELSPLPSDFRGTSVFYDDKKNYFKLNIAFFI